MTCRAAPLPLTALGVGDVVALLTLRPTFTALARDLRAPHAWVTRVGGDGAAITLVSAGLWCLALWLGVGLLAALAAQLPGGCGRMARMLARAVLPAAVYRVVAGAAGLSVLLAPAVATARAGATLPGNSANSISAPAIPAPSWPTDPPRSTPPIQAPGWPTSPPGPTRRATPAPPSTDSPVPQAAPTTPPSRRSGRVTVRPGDSLWRIASTRLGPRATPAQIAAAWPHWYAANSASIGADPDLIRPGQVLSPPTSTHRP